MFTLKSTKPVNNLAKLALACSVVALSGCGGGDKSSSGGQPANNTDTSGIGQAKINSDLNKGITQGLKSSVEGFSSVFNGSSFFSSFSGKTAEKLKTFTAAHSVAENEQDDKFDDAIATLEKLISKSDVQHNGNVYSFDPKEDEICVDGDASENANCNTILSNITFVVTVDNVVDGNVKAATSDFKYSGNTFAKMGFADTSGYYQVELDGMKSLLTGLNDIAAVEDKETIPETMTGSVKLSSTTDGENKGSLTLSIPSAVHIENTEVGKESDIAIAVTDNLIGMSVDGAANTMELELGLEALSLASTGKTDGGAPVGTELALQALSGKLSFAGETLTLTGLTANSVTFKVDTVEAATLNLSSLDATVATGTDGHSIVTFNNALSLSATMNNVSQYFDSEEDATYNVNLGATATSGTVMTDLGNENTKVTGGTFGLNITGLSDTDTTAEVTDGNCLVRSGTSSSFVYAPCPTATE